MTGNPSLVDNLRRSAARHPHRCAIQEGAVEVSYASLWSQVTTVAGALVEMGVRPGGRVALVLPNSAEAVAGVYGAMLAGAIAVPLNATARARDLKVWMQHCDASVVLGERDNRELAAAVAVCPRPPQQMHVSGDPAQPFGRDAVDPASAATPAAVGQSDAPACILYTSGTTGAPKGVTLSHRNLVSNAQAIVESLGLTAGDSIVTVLPFYYSYGSSVLHTHLQVGARLVLEKNFVYPHAVVETLVRERATGFAGVPSTFALLLSRVNLGAFDLSALRYVTQAGGTMAPGLTQRLRAALPGKAIFIMYGQTEATARLTCLPADRLADKPGSVGLPVRGVEIEIRGDDGHMLPAGAVGEIWVRGPNVMLGYWNDAAATAEVKRDGWLRTGDMGSRDGEGYLSIAGRRSDMIKSGAHRIHPRDIEDVIAELPGVQESVVVGLDDELLGQTIKAFVVPAAGATLTPMQVQAHCRDQLAPYKVPKAVEIVTALPRTASGKIRRTELARRTHS